MMFLDLRTAALDDGVIQCQEGERKMGKNVCYGDHTGHLCVLATDEKFDEIKQLTKNPEYICFNCGRVADCEANLCNPMPLK
jgi:hypothetical protein